jgi:ribosomal protein S6
MSENTSAGAVETSEKEGISRIYEVGYHIVPTVPENEVDAAVGAFRSLIEKSGGSFIAEGAPTLTRLSYGMDKREGEKYTNYDRAYFGWLKFEAPVEIIHALEGALKIDKNVLRHIVFQTVREETRARFKAPTLREVKRTDTIRSAPRREEVASAPVSEADLDKALQDITRE